MKKAKIAVVLAAVLGASSAVASDYNRACSDLPNHRAFKEAVNAVVDAGGNAGLGNEMWVSAVNRDGVAPSSDGGLVPTNLIMVSTRPLERKPISPPTMEIEAMPIRNT